jgi:hypothetical protein
MPDGETVLYCERLYGGSAKACACRLPIGAAGKGGWLECPAEARGILVPAPIESPIAYTPPVELKTPPSRPKDRASYSGDVCHTCGSPNMVRTGTCLTCQDCGESSGGCS